jgi:hypothetical protein
VFSASELKTRNRRAAREWELIRLGLEAERQRERNSSDTPHTRSKRPRSGKT